MEKKLLNLPTVRVDESLYADMHALAEIRGVHLADLIREACIAHIRAAEDEYHSLHSIFAGRERRRNAVSVTARNDSEAA